MPIEWQKQEVKEIQINCPYCGHQAAPPIYPYCEHTFFVYIDPAADDPGFDFVAPEFAAAYLSALRTSKTISEEDGNIDFSTDVEQNFLKNQLPSFNTQEIRLFDDLITDDLFSSTVVIFDVIEKDKYYPTRVIVAFKALQDN